MAVTINGSAGVTTNSGAVYDSLQRGTAVTASSTSVDFTSIPSWVKRITVMFSGVSTNGTGSIQVQIGTGATPTYTTSGYGAQGGLISGGSVSNALVTTGFPVVNTVSAIYSYSGMATLSLVTGNTWAESSTLGIAATANGIFFSGGSIALGGALTAIRVIASATGSPSDTFDAGTINIIYE